MTVAEASVGSVRSFIGTRRRWRWFDWYALGFAVVLAAVLASDVLVEPFSRLTASRGGSPPAQAVAGAALVIGAAAGLFVLAQTLGPLAVSPPDASWLLLSPLDRRDVLRRPVTATATLSALAGGVLGVLALAMAGPYLPGTHHQLWAWLTLAAVGGAGFFMAAVLAAVLAQPSRRQRDRLRGAALVVTAIAVLGGVAGGRWSVISRTVTDGFGQISGRTGWVLAILALAAAGGAAVLVRRMLPGFPAGVLRAESARASTTRLAATYLNVPLLTWVAEDNRWRGRLLTSRPWPRLAPALALAWVDWRRLARRRVSLIMLAASAVAPALAGLAITGEARGRLIEVTLLAGAVAAAAQGTGALRRETNDPTLRRLLGVDARPALAARAVLPALLSAAWLTLALTVLVLAGVLPGWLWPLLGLAAGPGAAAAALRIARAEPIDPGERGPETPLGPTPPWLVTRAISVVLGVIACFPVLKAVQSGRAHGGNLITQVIVSAVVLGGYLMVASGSSGRSRTPMATAEENTT